jgi:hypothetical protein
MTGMRIILSNIWILLLTATRIFPFLKRTSIPVLRPYFSLFFAVFTLVFFDITDPDAQTLTVGDSYTDNSSLLPDDGVTLYDRQYGSIGYNSRVPRDAIAQLQQKLDSGELQLKFDSSNGYLSTLLSALDINPESQMLVFSRTSLNFSSISVNNPRAIYFNDDTYLAWIPGTANIEIAAMDPALGPTFYTLDQTQQESPDFVRHAGGCLSCHDSLTLTGGGVPRFLLGSGYINESGNLVSHEGWIVTNQTTPLKFRWGGWYVTGNHGGQVHLGNVVIKNPEQLQYLDDIRLGNLANLDGIMPAGKYPVNYSDIVALMVIEHQVHIQNLITRVNYDIRTLQSNRENGLLSEADLTVINNSIESLLGAMFMANEAVLTDKISGSTNFAEQFESKGPFDSQGRSLRQLDLENRLFRYPFSYLIYSEAFAGLPEIAHEKIRLRIQQVLSHDNTSANYEHLSASDRTAILEILNDTLPWIL